jgi:hypothetical protein
VKQRKTLAVLLLAPAFLIGQRAMAGEGEAACLRCNDDSNPNCPYQWCGWQGWCRESHEFTSGEGSWRSGVHPFEYCDACDTHNECQGNNIAAVIREVDHALKGDLPVRTVVRENAAFVAVNLEKRSIIVRDCKGKVIATRQLSAAQMATLVAPEQTADPAGE